jgi:hypothetical protein
MLQQAEFSEIELVSETGFNSSPKTKGVLFRATKRDIHVENSLSASTHTNNRMRIPETHPKSGIEEREA